LIIRCDWLETIIEFGFHVFFFVRKFADAKTLAKL